MLERALGAPDCWRRFRRTRSARQLAVLDLVFRRRGGRCVLHDAGVADQVAVLSLNFKLRPPPCTMRRRPSGEQRGWSRRAPARALKLDHLVQYVSRPFIAVPAVRAAARGRGSVAQVRLRPNTFAGLGAENFGRRRRASSRSCPCGLQILRGARRALLRFQLLARARRAQQVAASRPAGSTCVDLTRRSRSRRPRRRA